MIEIKKLDCNDLPAVRHVMDIVRGSLANDSWFIPMSEETMEGMFSCNTTLTVYGAFVDGILAAIALIDTDVDEMADLTTAMNLPSNTGGELGACVVLPEYRGQHLMHLVCSHLVTVAKDMGLAYLVASAHPDNVASNRSLKKLGMEHRQTLVRGEKFLRNAYCLLL